MFLYNINYPRYEAELCNLEMKYIFGEVPAQKTFTSQIKINPDRSPFIKFSIGILQTGDTFEELLNNVGELEHLQGTYKVKFAGDSHGIDFNKRHELEGEIAYAIGGKVDIHEPEVTYGIAHFEDKWLLGIYLKNNGIWRMHESKPYYYSNALNTRIARTLINFAIDNNMKARLLDPCCGVGTVVMEGLSMGIDIKGYDINPKIVYNARRNLEYFEYPDVIDRGNLHELQGSYDGIIIDLPYGISSTMGSDERRDIIRSASRITNRIVIVSIEDIDEYLEDTGFTIEDSCKVSKMRFVRQISICKRNS